MEEMSAVRVKLSVKGQVDNGAAMYAVGNCPQLGQWKSKDALLLECQQEAEDDGDDGRSVWTGTVWLPRNTTILFRFFTGKVVPPEAGKEHNCMEVILWETNIQPRQVLTPDADELEVPLANFGYYDGSHTVSHGWLENHSSIQVRFHGNPVFMWKPKHRKQTYSIKCSPLDYEPGVEDPRKTGEQSSLFMQESSLDGPPVCNKTAMFYYNLNEDQLKPSQQPSTGCVYNKDDYLVFMARGFNQRYLGFEVDFFVHEQEEAPRFVGTAHLLPPTEDCSIHIKRAPIIGLNHRPIGEVKVEILRITPLDGYNWKMDVSYQNHWKLKRGTTLNVGHRGMGSSYKRVASAKENTICSMYSAAKHGADFVEFDVLLTKDYVPVIYHDFTICLSTATKKDTEKELLEVAVKDLCLKNLQSMKLFHTSSGKSGSIELTEEMSEEDHQPFPTLQYCLEHVDPAVGFNIEIKYPQLVETGENEMDNYFDLNPYIDRILDVVLKYGGDRKVIFSTFHADACIMVRLKQNKYSVLFLSNGPTKRYTPYKDWRCTTFQNGISFAKAEGLLGVNFQAEGLLQDLALIPHIKSLGLVLFVWGEDLNEHHVKQMLRKHEVDGIIFDRIGHQQPDTFTVESSPSLEEVMEQTTPLLPGSSGRSASSSLLQDNCV